MSILPSTSERVPVHTSPEVNRKISRKTECQVISAAANPSSLLSREDSLKREWNVERVLEANAASAVVIGSLLGLFKSRWFLLLPLAVGGFLLQHALQGWCPPLAIFRRLSFRTPDEIAGERSALAMLRGDFQPTKDAGEALRMARRVFTAGGA